MKNSFSIFTFHVIFLRDLRISILILAIYFPLISSFNSHLKSNNSFLNFSFVKFTVSFSIYNSKASFLLSLQINGRITKAFNYESCHLSAQKREKEIKTLLKLNQIIKELNFNQFSLSTIVSIVIN